MSLDAKLLACCNLAYEVTAPGPFHSSSDWYSKAGFVSTPVAVVGGPDGINAAIVGKIEEGTVVAFRGTMAFDDKTKPFADRLLDWVQDFEAELVAWRGVPGMVHEGFAAALDTLIPGLEEEIPDVHNVIYCGHSKGGALACLAAALDATEFAGEPTLVTFGSPRCGDETFASRFDSTFRAERRFENYGDIVPHVPFNSVIAELVSKYIKAAAWRMDYQSVGDLRFIRHGEVITSETLGNAFGLLDLGELLAKGDFADIRAAHSIHNVGHGYASIT